MVQTLRSWSRRIEVIKPLRKTRRSLASLPSWPPSAPSKVVRSSSNPLRRPEAESEMPHMARSAKSVTDSVATVSVSVKGL